MEFNALDVMDDATLFAGQLLSEKVKKEPLTVEVLSTIRSPEVLGSKYGKEVVENLILGAIVAYHSQLRTSLLEHGIDIGKFDIDED